MRRITSVSLCLLVVLQLLLAQEKPTLAVLEFDGFGIAGPEIQTLTNRLRTNLTQLGVYRIIERGLMLQVLLEQDFQMTGCTSDECAVEVGQLLGAQLMLAGSIGRVGNTWTVEMRIIDVETGAVTKSASYDTRGEIDLVLTEGMGAAARKIAGVTAPVEPVTAARPALRPAFLDVTTSPGGAVIFVNDIDRGTAPVSRLELPPGISHDISARLDRYHPVDTTLALETGEQARLNLSLQPMMGWLVLAGDAGAKVRLNGQVLGRTPLERLQLQMGLHQLSLTKPEHYRYSAEVAVEYDHITTVNYALKKKPKGSALKSVFISSIFLISLFSLFESTYAQTQQLVEPSQFSKLAARQADHQQGKLWDLRSLVAMDNPKQAAYTLMNHVKIFGIQLDAVYPSQRAAMGVGEVRKLASWIDTVLARTFNGFDFVPRIGLEKELYESTSRFTENPGNPYYSVYGERYQYYSAFQQIYSMWTDDLNLGHITKNQWSY